jgi:hypothetical protein
MGTGAIPPTTLLGFFINQCEWWTINLASFSVPNLEAQWSDWTLWTDSPKNLLLYSLFSKTAVQLKEKMLSAASSEKVKR